VPHVDVAGLISATPEFYEYPTCDRDPLPYWSTGRVTLLGDAAHPMYPVGSNGASQAVLDARCLADLLARSEHPRQALMAYEQKRLPMTAEIVRSNRRGGPEGVIDAVEQLAPDGFTDIEKVLSFAQREAIVRGYAFDPTKISPTQFKSKIPVSEGQLRYEAEHLRGKLTRRSPERLAALNDLEIPRAHPLFMVVPGDVETWERVAAR
jgi:hypothetical protein